MTVTTDYDDYTTRHAGRLSFNFRKSVKHTVYDTVANMRCNEAKCSHHEQFAVICDLPQVVSSKTKLFLLLVTSEYVGKQGTVDSVATGYHNDP